MQTLVFQVFRECRSWASRNGAVQNVFSDTSQNQSFGFVAGVYFLYC